MNNAQLDFVKTIEKLLIEIKKENFPEWQTNMEMDLTHAFLFNNVYGIIEKTKNKKKTLELLDLNSLHDIKGYKTVGDFIKTLTGDNKLNEDYGFETYYINLKEDWINTLFSEIDDRLANLNVEQQDSEEENREFIQLVTKFTDEFWDKWSQSSFKKVINKYYKDIWHDDMLISMEMDTKFKEDEHRFKQFETLAIEWLKYAKEPEVEKLKAKEKERLDLLQKWAEDKTYEELTLFENFFPKEKKLENFKWLNEKIRSQKLKEKLEIVSSIDALLDMHGVSVKTNVINYRVKQLYKLREAIFDIEGEKIVTLQNDDEMNSQFYLDEYNRVNGEGKGVVDFVLALENSLKSLSSLVVRQITKETYLKRQDGKEIRTPYLNVYGAVLLDGSYKGVTAKEMYQSNVVNPQTGQIEGDEGIRFVDWKIGNGKFN